MIYLVENIPYVKPSLFRAFYEKFRFQPTTSQAKGFEKISHFMSNGSKGSFNNQGFAGTGKTTLIGHLVRQLYHIKKNLFYWLRRDVQLKYYPSWRERVP